MLYSLPWQWYFYRDLRGQVWSRPPGLLRDLSLNSVAQKIDFPYQIAGCASPSRPQSPSMHPALSILTPATHTTAPWLLLRSRGANTLGWFILGDTGSWDTSSWPTESSPGGQGCSQILAKMGHFKLPDPRQFYRRSHGFLDEAYFWKQWWQWGW